MYKNILILPDGTELRSGAGTKNAIRSVKLTEMVNSGKELIIGSCCCDLLEASVFTPGGILEITAGDEIALWKESPDGQRVKMGIYTVEAPTRPTANTMKVAGYDHAAKLDKDLTAWLYELTDWPYSVNDFAAMVCTACGLTFIPEAGFPNEDFQIRQWSKSGVTGRQIMRWLGEIACRYVHADPDGNIRFAWYTESGKHFAPKGSNYYFAGSFSYENYQVAPVDIVQLRLAESESGAAWPPAEEGENPYIITGNAILAAYVTEDLLPVLEAIQAELAGITYTPCTVAGISDPTVRAGSIISVCDRNNRKVKAYVMEKTSSGQRDTYTCTGSPRRDSPSVMNNKTESEKTAEMEMNALEKMTQQEIFNRLTDNGKIQGLYIQDGKWYINAEVAQIINLIAEKVVSSLGTSTMKISGADLQMLWGNKETFYLWNVPETVEGGEEVGATSVIWMTSYRSNGQEDSAEISPTHLKLGGTSVMPVFYLDTKDGEPTLWLNGESKGKKLSWKENSDGTSTLIGRE